MPTYNTSAVVVDPINLSRSGGLPPETPLAFQLSGKLYLGYYHAGTLADKAALFRSSDDGATWDTPDIASAPTAGNQSAAYWSIGATIYFAHCDGAGGNDWVIDSFDTATDTYNTPAFNTGQNLFTDFLTFLVAVVDSLGTVYLIYEKSNRSAGITVGRSIYFNTFAGGVLGTETLLSVGHGSTDYCKIESFCIDETDRVHVCFSVCAASFVVGVAADFFWTSISPALVIASEVLLDSLATAYPDYLGPQPAVYLGQLIIFARDSAGLIITYTCATGTDAPTFATASLGLATVLPATTDTWPDMRPVIGSDGLLYVFYIRFVAPYATDQIRYIRTSDGTTWTSSSTYFDEVSYPVNAGQFGQALTFLHVIALSGLGFFVQSNAYIGFANIGIVMPSVIGAGASQVVNYIWCC